MMRNDLFLRVLIPIQRVCITNCVQLRKASSNDVNIEKLEQESALVDVIDEEAHIKEAEIEKKRNKSGLQPAHRNIVLDQLPYQEPVHWSHGTLKYMRKMYGKYGKASGVDPALCWPTKQELEHSLDYERTAYPFTIPQMIESAKKQKAEKEATVRAQQDEIVKKMLKLEQWKKELHDKIAKKEAEVQGAKERKDRLVEEVRRHFGYTIDPRDEKFKEMLEKKEKEQKKAMKEARRKVKEEKMVARLLNKPGENKPKEEVEKS